MLRRIFLSLLLIVVFSGGSHVTSAQARKILVFAPSSMADVMGDIVRAFNKETQFEAVLSVAGTPQLARQLDAGAPADIFISADRKWIDWVADRGLISKEKLFPVAGNRLVVAVNAEGEHKQSVEELLTKNYFAMAEPGSVPAGRYAQQALKNSGLWETVKDKAVFADNVRITTKRLARGEVSAALIYETDVRSETAIKTKFTFPLSDHAAIVYWVSSIKQVEAKAADNFMNYLRSEAATAIFAKAGFIRPDAASSKADGE